MSKYNDLDMRRWKEYSDIYTDSLWLIPKRDNSGAHSGSYHGNFIPQIPNQLLRRYTKEGDWILDPFMGSGTSLIEAQILCRNSVGIELQKSVADEAAERLLTIECGKYCGKIYTGDSSSIDIGKIKSDCGIENFQFVIMHPPYWDIVKFSDDPRDLSGTKTLDEFLNAFGRVIDNTCSHLEKDRYCAVIMGDKYSGGEAVPLGFYCMNLFLQRGYKLKATIVKNFEETRGKAAQRALWRYRALSNDFYIFKHEYIFVFKKMK